MIMMASKEHPDAIVLAVDDEKLFGRILKEEEIGEMLKINMDEWIVDRGTLVKKDEVD